MARTRGAQSGFDARMLELGIRNLDALVANFYKADRVMQEAYKQEVRETALQLQSLVAFLSPYDTGFMSEHVRALFTPSGFGFEVGWEAADFYEAGLAFYPFFQEFGTMYQPAQPSLGPGWDEVRPDYIARLGAISREALARTFQGPA